MESSEKDSIIDGNLKVKILDIIKKNLIAKDPDYFVICNHSDAALWIKNQLKTPSDDLCEILLLLLSSQPNYLNDEQINSVISKINEEIMSKNIEFEVLFTAVKLTKKPEEKTKIIKKIIIDSINSNSIENKQRAIDLFCSEYPNIITGNQEVNKLVASVSQLLFHSREELKNVFFDCYQKILASIHKKYILIGSKLESDSSEMEIIYKEHLKYVDNFGKCVVNQNFLRESQLILNDWALIHKLYLNNNSKLQLENAANMYMKAVTTFANMNNCGYQKIFIPQIYNFIKSFIDKENLTNINIENLEKTLSKDVVIDNVIKKNIEEQIRNKKVVNVEIRNVIDGCIPFLNPRSEYDIANIFMCFIDLYIKDLINVASILKVQKDLKSKLQNGQINILNTDIKDLTPENAICYLLSGAFFRYFDNYTRYGVICDQKMQFIKKYMPYLISKNKKELDKKTYEIMSRTSNMFALNLVDDEMIVKSLYEDSSHPTSQTINFLEVEEVLMISSSHLDNENYKKLTFLRIFENLKKVNDKSQYIHLIAKLLDLSLELNDINLKKQVFQILVDVKENKELFIKFSEKLLDSIMTDKVIYTYHEKELIKEISEFLFIRRNDKKDVNLRGLLFCVDSYFEQKTSNLELDLKEILDKKFTQWSPQHLSIVKLYFVKSLIEKHTSDNFIDKESLFQALKVILSFNKNHLIPKHEKDTVIQLLNIASNILTHYSDKKKIIELILTQHTLENPDLVEIELLKETCLALIAQ